jgi:HAD superfamily 5'-nucleotidase-like hydrolase
MSTWDPSLLPVPRSWDSEDEDRLAPGLKVYALRTLELGQVKAVGFDMDYTLARYRSPEIDALAFKKAVRLMVREKNYPAWLLEVDFDPAFAIRGLVLDGIRGNLLKVSQDRQVQRASHGTKPLSPAEIEACYGHRRLAVSAKGFRSVDTLFEIPEAGLYAQLVDVLDAGKLPGKDCLKLFHDVRWAIDTAHRQGDMKAEILEHRAFFIPRDPNLAPALDRWRRGGKKLFIATNSDWAFTHGVMGHLLDGQDDERPRWTDYFDLICVSTRKPSFFMDTPPAVPVPDSGCGHAYTGGNALWVEKALDASGEEVLYVGDHVYGDILRSKKNLAWRTLMLIPELEQELLNLEAQSDDLRELLRVETSRRRCERRVSLLLDEWARLRARRAALAPRLSPEGLHAIEREMAQLKAEADGAVQRSEALLQRAQQLNAAVEAAFHPRWGPLFRDRDELSRLADQMQQYACAYTGKISNLRMVDPHATLFAPLPALPHERL